jgi:hypothetical protein
VGRHEDSIENGRTQGQAIGSQDIRQHSRETARLTAHGPTDQQLQQEDHYARDRFDKEAKLRKQCREEMARVNAGKPQGAGQVIDGAADGENVEDCIQAFADLGFAAMREKVMKDYSDEVVPGSNPLTTRFQQTQQELNERVRQAEERLATANRNFANARTAAQQDAAQTGRPRPGRWDPVKRAGMEQTWAQADLAQARGARDSAHCMRAQASRGVPQDMSGSVPSVGGRRRERYTGPPSTSSNEEV